MEYRISYTPDFERHFKKLCKKHEFGTPLGFNLFKIRLKIASKGKGYDKSEIENLSKSQLKALLEIAGLI
jgi:hypothetical protein